MTPLAPLTAYHLHLIQEFGHKLSRSGLEIGLRRAVAQIESLQRELREAREIARRWHPWVVKSATHAQDRAIIASWPKEGA